MNTSLKNYNPWPELNYESFAPTAHLLHMGIQAIGKLKLLTPFEPEWANVPLWITSRGLTTGPIPYKSGIFTVDVDLVEHQIIVTTSWGKVSKFGLHAMSVADFTKLLFAALQEVEVNTKINTKPQEIPNPISFDQDIEPRPYEAELAHAWWQILVSSYRVMLSYHSRFTGKTPPIGLMWGTFDLRDARYQAGASVPTTGPNSGYLRRNAMDEAQVEAGWWHGNPSYHHAAYFSFTYPQPKEIEKAKIKPTSAHWDDTMKLFILNYDDVRKSKDPEGDLYRFLESTYQVGAKRAGWGSELVGSGVPI